MIEDKMDKKTPVSVKNICKAYGDTIVLQDLNLEFRMGSRTIIMAPSGYGKTTLLRILMGLETADSGTITGIPAKKSAVFQENRLCDSFTAAENIEMIDRFHGCPDTKELLCEIGLGDSLKKPVKKLSGGMQRRCAIVRAMASDSEIIFLDEPFQGLDVENHRMTAEFIKKYLNGRTLIVVSHNVEDAELLGAEIINI